MDLLGNHSEGDGRLHREQLRALLRGWKVHQFACDGHALQADGAEDSAVLYEPSRRLRKWPEVQILQLRAVDLILERPVGC